MRTAIKNLSVILLATVFFAFGSGVTVCKMVCLSSGDIQFALNEEGSCCDDTEEEGCCEDEAFSDNEMECCTHTDNLLQLDQYVPGDKVFIASLNQGLGSTIFFTLVEPKINTALSITNYHAPPPLQIEDISSFTHRFRI